MPILSADQLPKYRKHRASGQAIVALNGREHYLGPHGTKASRLEYDRLIGEWLANGRRSPVAQSDMTILELANAYRKFAEAYYVKDGQSTGAIFGIRVAIRFLCTYYGRTLAAEFGPLALAALQHRMVEASHCRRYINSNIDHIRRCFKWAVAQELTPASVYQALRAVPGLKRGRTTAPEPEPIRPIDDATVEATLPFLPVVVADMVRFQRLTGCRPGEVRIVRPCDIDRSDDVWQYRPESHKTEHHGRQRAILIGPKAQEILRLYLLRAPDTYCFVPAESELSRLEQKHAARKTPLSYGNRPGTHRVRKPKRHAGERYDRNSYARAVLRACDRADRAAHEAEPSIPADKRVVERWAPNRLRHSMATVVRKGYGLEAVQVVLGHARADVTQVYAERDLSLGFKVVREIG